MKPPGSFKISGRTPVYPTYLDPLGRGSGRLQKIVESLRCQIVEGGPTQNLRIRQVFASPREIFRIEIEVPEMNYLRTTLLDRDALEDLLETEEVRDRISEP